MENSRKLKLVFGWPLASASSSFYMIMRIFDGRNNGPTMNRTTHWMHVQNERKCIHSVRSQTKYGWMHRSEMMRETKTILAKKRAAWFETKSKTTDRNPHKNTIVRVRMLFLLVFGVVSIHSIAATHFMCARIVRLCLCEHIYLSFFSFPFACLSLHSFRLRFELFSGSWADEFVVPNANSFMNRANTKCNISRKKSFTFFCSAREWEFFFFFRFVSSHSNA